MSEEPMMEKSVPVPEGKSIERESIADKMVAVEYGGASHAGVTKAAHVPAKVPPTKATSVAATVAATVHGGRTQSRAGRGNRSGGQYYRYLPHHDVHSTSCEMHPSLCEGRQSPSSWSAQRRCSMSRLQSPSPTFRMSVASAASARRVSTARAPQHRHGDRNNQITYALVSD